MNDDIKTLLLHDKARFQAKSLFGESGDSLSMRIPGRNEFLLAISGSDDFTAESIDHEGDDAAGIHAALYRSRPDAGAVLIGLTRWSSALGAMNVAIPTLFDEHARHIGKVETPVPAGQVGALLNALKGGANIAIYGEQRVCLGATSDRVVFNAELFEKCAKAFVIASASGERIRKIPGWVCFIAGSRLRKDQKRSAESYAAGRVPQDMNAY